MCHFFHFSRKWTKRVRCVISVPRFGCRCSKVLILLHKYSLSASCKTSQKPIILFKIYYRKHTSFIQIFEAHTPFIKIFPDIHPFVNILYCNSDHKEILIRNVCLRFRGTYILHQDLYLTVWNQFFRTYIPFPWNEKISKSENFDIHPLSRFGHIYSTTSNPR